MNQKFIRILLISGALLLSACAQNQTSTEPESPFGKSVSTGEACGGMMGVVCANEVDFCQIDISGQCGAADQMGSCQPRPEMCTQQYDPVCGCDGKTYGNACTAASAGVSAAYAGECKP